MKKTLLSKPRFLSLDEKAKQNIIVNIKNNNLDDADKQITQEGVLDKLCQFRYFINLIKRN